MKTRRARIKRRRSDSSARRALRRERACCCPARRKKSAATSAISLVQGEKRQYRRLPFAGEVTARILRRFGRSPSDPERRGEGLGAKLIEFALLEARRRGIARVFAVTHAPQFFERQGFVAASRHALTEKSSAIAAPAPSSDRASWWPSSPRSFPSASYCACSAKLRRFPPAERHHAHTPDQFGSSPRFHLRRHALRPEEDETRPRDSCQRNTRVRCRGLHHQSRQGRAGDCLAAESAEIQTAACAA